MLFPKSRRPRVTEAKLALNDAQKQLKKTKAREPEVKQLSEATKKFRRENHFALDLQTLFEGGPR